MNQETDREEAPPEETGKSRKAKSQGGRQHQNVFEAKLAVQAEVHYVQKTGKLDMGKRSYTFASDQDLIRKVRPVLMRHGIVMSRVRIVEALEGTYPTREGTAQRLRILARWRFTHVWSQTHDRIEVMGEGGDSGDKCSGKANTLSLKYALIDWLQLTRGDDPDREIPEGATAPRTQGFQAAAKAIRSAASFKLLQSYHDALAQRSYSEEERAELLALWAERYAALARAWLPRCKHLDVLEDFHRAFENKDLPEAIKNELTVAYRERLNSLGGRSTS